MFGVEKSKKQHYYLVLMLDGHKINYPSKVISLAKQIWEGRELGHIPTIKNPYYMIEREDLDSYAKAFYRISYLAKVRGKGVGKSGKLKALKVNDYYASRINFKVSNSSFC